MTQEHVKIVDELKKHIPDGIASGNLLAVQVFTSSGTYTPTSGMANCIIQCVGGGGAGGGSPATTNKAGCGGGSGGYSQSYVTAATIGASQTVTIGAGGTGSANATGGNGSATSVGSIVVANGGTGGGTNTGAGGAGATAGTGDIALPGSSGIIFWINDAGAPGGGNGGGSFFGCATPQVFSSSNGSAAVANTGAGGGGAKTVSSGDGTHSGGNGGSGIVIIYEYDSSGSTTLPTIANHIATYSDTAGTLSEDPSTAISGGNIQAGLSGTAGYLASFPSTASKGSVRLTAADSAGNTVTTITNASQAAARTYTIPDAGASSDFLLTNSSGTQTIASGNLTVSAGSISAPGGLVQGGDVYAGSDGVTGRFRSYPTTATNGFLVIQAVNAGGPYVTTISNGTMAQSTAYTIGDIGASSGGIVVATSAIRMKSVAAASATGGSASETFTDSFCTTGSNVVGNWNTQTNAASVLKIVPGNGSFTVTSTADAGSGTFNYIIIK